MTIDKLVFRGDGLARGPDGRALFIPYAAPGDEARVRIVEERPDFARGEIQQILRPSPHRVEPPCPYFGRCGGCQWLHVSFAVQGDWKRAILTELLERVGKLRDLRVAPTISPPDPWRYRARAQFKVEGRGRPPRVGYYRGNSQEVVDIGACPLLHPAVEGALRSLRGFRDPAIAHLFPGLREVWVMASTSTDEVVVSLFARRAQRAALRLCFNRLKAGVPGLVGLVLFAGGPAEGPRQRDRIGRSFVEERIRDLTFRIDAASFFQVSGQAAGRLIGLVEGYAGPPGAPGAERVLDLYCGVGTFTLPLARRALEVVGVEVSRAAAMDAGHNARSNGCANVRIVPGQVEQALPGLAAEGPWDTVVLDPPRQGCSSKVIEAVCRIGPRRIVYVSCDPSTLARDLGKLVRAGYRCEEITPLDLFPETYHLEAVALLERAGVPS